MIVQPHPNSKQAYRLLHQGILAFSDAEHQGIRIDLEYCESMEQKINEEIKEISGKLLKTKFYRHWQHTLGGKKPNMNSNAQLGRYLYKTKKLTPLKKTVTGQGSTDEEALMQLNIPELNQVLRIRRLKKIRDTYLKGFVKEQVNQYIHPNFNLHIVRTFRSSSDKPNFQNIPKRDEEAKSITRKALYPRPGHQLMEVDYSGIEVCVSACYHQDPTMVKYIKDPKSDMHRDMATQIFMIDKFDKKNPMHKTLRSAAKNGFVFPQFYGDYYGNCAVSLAGTWGKLPEGKWKKGQGLEIEEGRYLSDHLISKGIKSLNAFTDHIQDIEKHFWNWRFPVYAKWKDRQWEEYQANGYVDLLTGFRCSGIMSYNDVTNYPIQGAAFHFLLWAFIQTNKELKDRGMKSRLIGQIHDAMVLDVHPDELDPVAKMLQKIMVDRLMKTWDWIVVPLSIEIDIAGVDKSWNEMEPYKM